MTTRFRPMGIGLVPPTSLAPAGKRAGGMLPVAPTLGTQIAQGPMSLDVERYSNRPSSWGSRNRGRPF